MHLRIALENGESYLSPMLVDEFKDMRINVIFADHVLKPQANKILSFSYMEPCVNEKSGDLIPPVIIVSEIERRQ